MPENDIELAYVDIANRVRNLMERHGVAPRRQASELSRILSLSFSAASRKMKGQLPWDLKQLAAVATHFGETPSVLVENNDALDGAISGKGMLMAGHRPLPCSLTIGAELAPDDVSSGRSTDLIAVRAGELWRVYPVEEAPAGRAFNVLSVEIRPGARDLEVPLVAVLDDDTETHEAENVCAYLNDHGIRAIPFYDLASFRESFKNNTFKAFVLDWLINDDTTEATIADIRKTSPAETPIFLLTGQLKNGRASEEDIARVIQKFRCKWLEKPIRMPILFSEISSQLTQTAGA